MWLERRVEVSGEFFRASVYIDNLSYFLNTMKVIFQCDVALLGVKAPQATQSPTAR